MKTFGDTGVALPADRANAVRLSSAEDWRNKPMEAFKKFIRATPSRQGRGGYSKLSVLQHEARFNIFFDFMLSQRGIDILNIDVHYISMFLAELQGRNPAQPALRTVKLPQVRWAASAGTKDRYVKLLDTIFDGLVSAGYRDNNPVPVKLLDTIFDGLVSAGYRDNNPVPEAPVAEDVARLAASANAAGLSSVGDWHRNPRGAFKKFIRALPFGRRQGAYSNASIRQFEAEFKQFNKFLVAHPGINVLNVGADHILMFVAKLQGRPPAQPASRHKRSQPIKRAAHIGTKDRYVKLLINVFNGLVLAGYRSDNPALEAQQRLDTSEGEADAEITFLNEDDDERFTEYLMHEHPVSTWSERRQRAMLLFIHRTGVECSVARHASVDDFILDDGAPFFEFRSDRVHYSITNYFRLPLDEFCGEGVLEWVKERKAYLDRADFKDETGLRLAFPSTVKGRMLSHCSLWQGANRCLDAIGLSGGERGGRVLRNTFIRRQILAGKSNREVQYLAGLNTDTTVQRLRRMA